MNRNKLILLTAVLLLLAGGGWFLHDSGFFQAVRSLEELLALLEGQDPDRAWVCGGGEIYRLLLPYTDRILVTRWDAVLEADTFFPNLDASGEFFLAEQSPRQESGGLGFCFCEYRRKK